MFFRIWTKKESYVKMTGKGLSSLKFKKDFSDCFFEEFTIEEYRLAICSKSEEKAKFITDFKLF